MIWSSFIFKENQVFIEEEDNPSNKAVKVEEELDGIRNLVDLPGPIFLDEKCGNLKGNAQFIQKVTFETLMDFKQNHCGSWKYYKSCYF